MAAQYQVSSTEYNPSYSSRKTKELFTPGQGPVLAVPGAQQPPAWPQQTLLLERLDPTQSPGKAVNREGEPALDGLAWVWQLLLFQDPAGKSRDDTQPCHPALEWGPCWFTPPCMGVRAPTASLSTLPEDGGTGHSGTPPGAGLEPVE